MNWTWFALGIYGLIGISRFAWAMHRKATWDKNVWAQETIRNLSGVALLVTVLFETFLWPVELVICFYLVLKEKRKKKERNPYLTARKPYKSVSSGMEQCQSMLVDQEGKNSPSSLQCIKFEGHGGLHEAAGMRWVSPR